MAKPLSTFENVCKLASELGAEASGDAIKLDGKLLAWISPHKKKVEPDSLVVLTEIERRAEMIAEAPETYYVIDHYLHYPAVLVRLPKIGKVAMRDLLLGARTVERPFRKRAAISSPKVARRARS